MNDNRGLIFAYELDGQGGGRALDMDGVRAWRPGAGPLWVHLDYTGEDAVDWLDNHSGLEPLMVQALTAVETRPRTLVHRDGLLGILRGVNLNPGADPEDMVSIRFWLDADRIITLRHRRIMAIDDLRQAVAAGEGPAGPGEFLSELADRLVGRVATVISELDDTTDGLESEVVADQTAALRQNIADVRRVAIALRRYLAPQRDVMARLHTEKVDWLDETERLRLREVADRTTRFVEDLDAIRERASVTQEELNGRIAERMNRTMYILSIVAGIFLPLGLLTGLLGINVGGIPGTDNPWAFSIFCVLLVALAAVQVWVFRRKHWM